jgi:RNA polymerase sigma-70 factor, ECF subfamily
MEWNHTIETEMLRRASGGDQEAYEHLYHKHLPSVRSWCWQITKSFADVEDLTQEVFMRFYLKLPTFRHESSLRTWLYRVAVNCSLMHLRQRKRATVSLDTIEIHAPRLAARIAAQSATRTTGAGERLIIEQAIRALPLGNQSVLIMHDISGLRHNEIAHRLGLSMEGSKCRLRRARRDLRLLLGA